jgi:hypothetical protein
MAAMQSHLALVMLRVSGARLLRQGGRGGAAALRAARGNMRVVVGLNVGKTQRSLRLQVHCAY